MKLKNRKFKMLSLFCAFAMIIGITNPMNVQAANPLKVAQYVHEEGNTVTDDKKLVSTYHGKVYASVPMTEIMGQFESQMKSEATSGHFPWDKDTVSTSAYVEDTVSLPENAKVGTIKTSSTSSMFPANTIKYTNKSNKITFKFKLQDTNWQQIYDSYNKDKNDANNHTVNFSIPYTITVNNQSDADKLKKSKVTGQGEFSFYPSRTWGKFGIGLQTFKTDVYSGTYTDDLSRPFNVLEGDILVNGDTEHDAVYKTKQGKKLKFTGVLDVSKIKTQLKNIEDNYPNTEKDKITLNDTKSTFEAVFTLPKDLSFSEMLTKDNVLFEGGKDTFKVTDVKVNGQSVTVTMSLKEGITDFVSLKNAVNACDDELKVTVPGVLVSKDAKDGSRMTVKGTLTGSMSATAKSNGNTVPFKFEWEAKQSAKGKDAVAVDNDTIQATVETVRTVNVSKEDELDGDITIDDDTEHTQVKTVKSTDTLAYTGVLDVTKVKSLMKQIENQYKNGHNGSSIFLEDTQSVFKASFTLPEGLTASNISVETVKLAGADCFKITDVSINGKLITVTMTLQTKNIKTYEDLSKAILNCDDKLKVTIPNITIDSNVENNTLLTVKGTLEGMMSSLAEYNSNYIHFNFKWNAVQSAEGKDFTQAASDNKTIAYTIKVNKINPVQPPVIKPSQPKDNGKVNPKITKTGKKTNKPKTGDQQSLLKYSLLVLGSVIVILIALRYKKLHQ